MIAQGDVCWADLPDPAVSGPGFRRPVLVVQGDSFNRSRIATIVCVPLTSNLKWAEAPGNVLLPRRSSGLSKDSVANVSQIVTLDRTLLTERVGRISKRQMGVVFAGVEHRARAVIASRTSPAARRCPYRSPFRRGARPSVSTSRWHPDPMPCCWGSPTRSKRRDHGRIGGRPGPFRRSGGLARSDVRHRRRGRTYFFICSSSIT